MSIISLVGMMGAGKTTVAKVLSVMSRKKYFDTDEVIEKQMPISRIFECYGEQYFRKIEYETILDLLNSNNKDCIISVGGGAFIQENIRFLLLQKAYVIWLKISFATVKERIKMNETQHRPMAHLLNTKFFEGRNQVYKKAQFHIDCDQLMPSDIAQIILSL